MQDVLRLTFRFIIMRVRASKFCRSDGLLRRSCRLMVAAVVEEAVDETVSWYCTALDIRSLFCKIDTVFCPMV